MLSKTLYKLHVYFHADSKKDSFSRIHLYCTPASTHLLCQHTFATYYQKISLKSPGLIVFLSAQCIETQARTSDNVKTWVFNSLNVQ